MANDLATLSSKLATQLRDIDHEVWRGFEMDDLIKWSVASLWPQFARYLDPSNAAQEITLVAETYFYTLPVGMMSVHTAERFDGTEEYGPISGQAWQVVGDPIMGTAKFRVAPIIAEQGGKVRLHGYGRFDTSTNTIPDDYVPLVLAQARAEAYRRMGADRTQFKQWQVKNPVQNITINELLLEINEADAEINRWRQSLMTWKRPVPGRLG